jgi:hypothetical protein
MQGKFSVQRNARRANETFVIPMYAVRAIAKQVFGLTQSIGHLRRPETVPVEQREFPPERAQAGVVGGAPIREAPRPSHVPPKGMHVHKHALTVRCERRGQPLLRGLDAPLPLPDREYRCGVQKYGLRLTRLLRPIDDTFMLTAEPSPCLIRCLSTWAIAASDHSTVVIIVVVVGPPPEFGRALRQLRGYLGRLFVPFFLV